MVYHVYVDGRDYCISYHNIFTSHPGAYYRKKWVGQDGARAYLASYIVCCCDAEREAHKGRGARAYQASREESRPFFFDSRWPATGMNLALCAL